MTSTTLLVSLKTWELCPKESPFNKMPTHKMCTHTQTHTHTNSPIVWQPSPHLNTLQLETTQYKVLYFVAFDSKTERAFPRLKPNI